MSDIRVEAKIPVALDCPEQMRSAIEYVLAGEYESHHDGTGLDILDIGANVGSFAHWAVRRWPGSRVFCFEPNPGTFDFLKRNTAGLPGVTITNAALFPGPARRAQLFSRYAGDGEAGLAAYAGDTFIPTTQGRMVEVDVVDPGSLPSADIVKIDIEGGEAEVLAHLDLSRTSLVLAEFQNRKNRLAMQGVLARDFVAMLDEESPWEPILDYMDYKRELKGDVYGRMFYARRGQTRLAHRPAAG